jgi:hypothetical protein
MAEIQRGEFAPFSEKPFQRRADPLVLYPTVEQARKLIASIRTTYMAPGTRERRGAAGLGYPVDAVLYAFAERELFVNLVEQGFGQGKALVILLRATLAPSLFRIGRRKMFALSKS